MTGEPQSRDRLPTIHEGRLDHDELALLQSDLLACARHLGVMVKRAAHVASSDRPLGLARAMDMLRRGDAGSIQIRYTYQEEMWCDTIMKLDEGFRLVRVRTDAGQPGADQRRG